MKNKGFIAKVSLFIFVLVFVGVFMINFVLPVYGNTHTSIVSVTPRVVPNASSVNFTAYVKWTSGDPIHEFRVYQPIEFSGLVCYETDGWYSPTYGYTTINGTEYYYCHWSAKSGQVLDSSNPEEYFNFSLNTAETECCRDLFLETRDDHGYYKFHNPQVCVDTSPPITTKNFSGPYKIDSNGREWIDTVTKVILNATDPQPHPSNVSRLFWRDSVVREEYCESEYSGCQYAEGSGNWSEAINDDNDNLITIEIKKHEESCHLLEFYSVDNVGNVEPVRKNCFFVDKTPPAIDKIVGVPFVEDYDQEIGIFFWVIPDTNITFTCTDQDPHPSKGEELCFRVSYDQDDGYKTDEYCLKYQGSMEGDWCCVPAAPNNPFIFNFNSNEDSLHNLEYFCRDAVNKTSNVEIQWYKVDSTPPLINKTMIGKFHLGACPPKEEGDGCYVKDDGENGVRIEVKDNETYGCAVDDLWCYYELWWESSEEECKEEYDDGWCLVDYGEFYDYVEIIFTRDSTHYLYVYCEDGLGNWIEDEEEFLVDSTPPTITKTYASPFYSNGTHGWINSSTPINLTATDEKVGVDHIRYRYCLDTGCYGSCECGCEEKPWIVVEDNSENDTNSEEGIVEVIFTIPQDSEHCIEYQAEDKLGNEGSINFQCVYADNTPPEAEKEIGEPKVIKDGYTYISSSTPITLRCKDLGEHSVGCDSDFGAWCRYRYADSCEKLENAGWHGWFSVQSNPVYLPEDSCHELEYYCVDRLGNKGEVYSEIDIVDNKPPIIEKRIIGPQWNCGEEGDCYINSVTKIEVNATDPQPHPVEGVTCRWWYYLNDGNQPYHTEDGVRVDGKSDWIVPPFNISFLEESKHELHIECRDALNATYNTNSDTQIYFVDKTPPMIEKNYIGPYFEYDNEYYAEFINNKTGISVKVQDVGQHKSGIKKVEFRVSLVDDEHCKDYDLFDKYKCEDARGSGVWEPLPETNYTDEEIDFYIPNESCHLIEIRAIDNVNKTSIRKQCVFVDNEGPELVKEIGEPKTKWNGEDAVFYNISDRCWKEGGIECWKVTKLTPITLNCSDPGPHPVDHNRVCFKVEVDGEDKTSDYCPPYDHGFIMPLCTGEECEDDWEMENGYCCINAPVESFYFKEETEHNLKFYCKDALGNKGREDEEKFKVEGVRFEIPLFKKWNLISVPFVLLNDTPEEVFKNTENVTSVWTYDPEHVICGQDWCVWSPGDAPDNLRIKPGWGYWVLAKGDDLLVIGGSLMSPATIPPSRNLTKGWNLIGYYGVSWELYPYMSDFDYMCGDYFREPIQRYVYGDKSYCALFSLVDTQTGYPRWSALWSYLNCGGHIDFWIGLNACPDSEDHPILSKFSRMYAGRGYWIEMDVPDIYAPSTTCIWNEDYQCIWTGGGIVP